MIFKDLFNLIDYSNALLYPYSNRTHDIDFNFLNFCLTNKINTAIICDTGSNDMTLLEKFCAYGIDCIILDHHITVNTYTSFPSKVSIVNTELEKEYYGINNEMCGGAISFVIASALLEKKGITYDIGYFATYALIAQYADLAVMDTEFGKYLYETAKTRKTIPKVIDYFLDSNFGITRRFAEYILAPKINAAFRREEFKLINDLFLYTGTDDFVLINRMKELHKSTIKIVDTILKNVKFSNLGGVLLANLSPFLNTALPNNFIINHKGRIANAIASKYGQPCICVCDNGRYIEGSLRAPRGGDYLQYFAPLINAGGHPSAFGFTIPYTEWEYFKNITKEIASRENLTCRQSNKVIEMNYGLDIDYAYKLAYDNEFASSRNPPAYIKIFLKKVDESTRYGYSYRIGYDGLNSIWASSDRKIDYPCSVIVYPYLQKDLKFKFIWE